MGRSVVGPIPVDLAQGVSSVQDGARIVQMQEADIDAVATLEAEVSPAPWGRHFRIASVEV